MMIASCENVCPCFVLKNVRDELYNQPSYNYSVIVLDPVLGGTPPVSYASRG